MSSADNLSKQFGPRSGPTKRRTWSGSKLFDLLIIFLIEYFEKVDFEKNQQTTKKDAKFPSMQRVNSTFTDIYEKHIKANKSLSVVDSSISYFYIIQ